MINAQTTLAVCLLAMFALIGLWDVVATARNGGADTVSNILGTWSARFPILPLAVGVIMGHLFWPRLPIIP